MPEDGDVVSRPVQFDLTLSVGEFGDGLAGVLEYSTALFDDARMRRLVGHLRELLTAVAADAGRPVSRLPLLTAGEHDQLRSWNDTAAPAAAADRVHELIEARAAAAPDRIAVECGGAALDLRPAGGAG